MFTDFETSYKEPFPYNLLFIEVGENKGQWQPNILYKASIPEGTVYLENNLFTYCFYNSKQLEEFHHPSHENKKYEKQHLKVDGFSFKVICHFGGLICMNQLGVE